MNEFFYFIIIIVSMYMFSMMSNKNETKFRFFFLSINYMWMIFGVLDFIFVSNDETISLHLKIIVRI